MKKIVLVCVVALLAFACKNEAKETTQKETKVVVKKAKSNPELKVTISFKSNKADEFKLTLNNVIVDEFQKKNVQVIEKITASNKIDELTASFGENNISKNFVIGLGNKVVKEVEIENITLTYGDNTQVIKALDLPKHFVFNKFTSFNEAALKINTKKVDGKHAPALILKAKTLNNLKKIKK